VCVECLIGKKNKPTLVKVSVESQYGVSPPPHVVGGECLNLDHVARHVASEGECCRYAQLRPRSRHIRSSVAAQGVRMHYQWVAGNQNDQHWFERSWFPHGNNCDGVDMSGPVVLGFTL
jgi:hypothetical protein